MSEAIQYLHVFADALLERGVECEVLQLEGWAALRVSGHRLAIFAYVDERWPNEVRLWCDNEDCKLDPITWTVK